jgi:hypothetical protein
MGTFYGRIAGARFGRFNSETAYGVSAVGNTDPKTKRGDYPPPRFAYPLEMG